MIAYFFIQPFNYTNHLSLKLYLLTLLVIFFSLEEWFPLVSDPETPVNDYGGSAPLKAGQDRPSISGFRMFLSGSL